MYFIILYDLYMKHFTFQEEFMYVHMSSCYVPVILFRF